MMANAPRIGAWRAWLGGWASRISLVRADATPTAQTNRHTVCGRRFRRCDRRERSPRISDLAMPRRRRRRCVRPGPLAGEQALAEMRRRAGNGDGAEHFIRGAVEMSIFAGRPHVDPRQSGTRQQQGEPGQGGLAQPGKISMHLNRSFLGAPSN